MTRVFVDADVILDLFVAHAPFHGDALRFFSRLKAANAGFTCPLIVANVHYVLSRLRSRRYALDHVRALRGFLSVLPLTQEILDAATAAPHKDFEDALQYQCALLNGMTLLVTRNVKHFPAGPLQVAQPVEYLASSR